MKLEGTLCSEDIDNEHLRVFSTAEKTHFSNFVINGTSSSSKGQGKFQEKNTN